MEDERADVEEVQRIALGEMTRVVRKAGRSKLRNAVIAKAAALALGVPAKALAEALVHLDTRIAESGLPRGGSARLEGYGVAARIESDLGFTPIASAPPLADGPLVVVSNHPGLYDCLVLFAGIGRRDLATIAATRPLLAALPNLSRHLLSIPEGASAGLALRAGLKHLAMGGALLHFPAGAIEPDPCLVAPGEAALSPWKPGLEALLALASKRGEVRVTTALVSGVISRRAKRFARALAFGSGATDPIVPLLQLTFSVFGDVDARVRFGPMRRANAPGVVEALREDLTRMAETRAGNARGARLR